MKPRIRHSCIARGSGPWIPTPRSIPSSAEAIPSGTNGPEIYVEHRGWKALIGNRIQGFRFVVGVLRARSCVFPPLLFGRTPPNSAAGIFLVRIFINLTNDSGPAPEAPRFNTGRCSLRAMKPQNLVRSTTRGSAALSIPVACRTALFEPTMLVGCPQEADSGLSVYGRFEIGLPFVCYYWYSPQF